jgi:galactose mutarotase-like enzyme
VTEQIMRLSAGGGLCEVSSQGGELRSWRPSGAPDLLWTGDPAHWAFWAPVLFPIVGTLKGGRYRWQGRDYELGRHGFARFRSFSPVLLEADRATFALTDDAETRAAYPFAFGLLIDYRIDGSRLEIGYRVENRGGEAMPYALGFHPAFRWPFAGGVQEDYRVEFAAAEAAELKAATPQGLVRARLRPSPLNGRRLDLAPGLFAEDALIFADARSDEIAFAAADGAAIVMTVENFPHLAIWTKTTAPFLSLEAWTSHSDPEEASGDLADKPGMRMLPPGETARHAVTLSWRAPTG